MPDLLDKARALREQAQRLLTEAGRLEAEQRLLDRPERVGEHETEHLFCGGCGTMRLHDVIVQKEADLTICKRCGTRERVTAFAIESIEMKDGLGKPPPFIGTFTLAMRKIGRIART